MNLKKGVAMLHDETTQAVTVYIDQEKEGYAKENLITQKEFLLQNGVFFVLRGEFSDVKALHYKINMFHMQKMLSRSHLKSLVLYDFNAENVVIGCTYEQNIKSYLMKIKAKDGQYLFLTVEFISRKGHIERSTLYFQKKHKNEVMSLVNCTSFWNSVKVVKLTLERRTMFNSVLRTAVEMSNE